MFHKLLMDMKLYSRNSISHIYKDIIKDKKFYELVFNLNVIEYNCCTHLLANTDCQR